MGTVDFRIIGVHPVDAPEPCHLFEVELKNSTSFEWDSITQEIEGQPRSSWQVAWDEHQLDENRWTFFFHHLDFSKPLLTGYGPVDLPEPSPLPNSLAHVIYERPC